MNNIAKSYKKLHRWPGLIISFILLYYGITGIIMNHRELVSKIDINRHLLPSNYAYKSWNNAALKGDLIINQDSILVYGNIGVWLTDSTFTRYSSFNAGFPVGSDNRKIFDVQKDRNGNLYTATLFGFYAFDKATSQWKKLSLPGKNERFTGIENIGDTLYVLNRSYLFKGKSEGIRTCFTQIELPAPANYDNRISLFSTIWQIHSGEILGIPGKLLVDLLGIITIFLSTTGILYFFFSKHIKRRKRTNKQVVQISKVNRWSLRWHNKIGAWTFVLLIILFFTGMFLRPPLLIAIAKAKVKPLKYSHLDQPNPWYDKLRDILYDPERKILMLSTSDGMFFVRPEQLKPIRFTNQPPVSVMGINTLQPLTNGEFLIGSFSGLFRWNPDRPEIFNYVTGKIYREPASGRPVGDYKITGAITTCNGEKYMVDYDKGILPLSDNKTFPGMPSNILQQSKISLWSTCLEFHTGRIFQCLIGDFYILIVPLTGLLSVMVVLSGYLLWKKRYKSKSNI